MHVQARGVVFVVAFAGRGWVSKGAWCRRCWRVVLAMGMSTARVDGAGMLGRGVLCWFVLVSGLGAFKSCGFGERVALGKG